MTYDVTTYGATGDGSTDDRAAIQDAIDAAKLAGGGTVFFPKGVYMCATSVPVSLSPVTTTPVCLVIDGDNINLLGEGVGNSIIKLADATNAKLVGFGHSKNNSIQKLELDGNRANQNANSPVVLYSFGSLTNFIIRDMFVHHSQSYGVGLMHGAMVNILLENVLIEDTDQDGFDNKNGDGADHNNRMNNVTVRRAGLRTSLSGQACIDLRGTWLLNNIQCLDFNHTTARCKSGIRFRPNNTSDGAVGSHKSSLTNFYIKPSAKGNTVGVEVNGNYNSVGKGFVENAEIGVKCNNYENTVGNVVAVGCDDGFLADNSSTTNGYRCVFSACIARGCVSGFKSATTNTIFSDIIARSNTHGINLRNGSVNTIISGLSSSNSGANLNKESGGITWTDTGLVY